ncbi:hypothetical protein CCAN11_2450032 [Capnocytophaga canimorsus]|uniref:Fe-S oxidoreductase n=1 Tax=Capnocytophaga canimorsus TaxID=28188 RepID=A0A0B7IQX1_9FLAO|nr:hypothetical protein CCAN11_2450032 [Capnocytophaga canimorsus]
MYYLPNIIFVILLVTGIGFFLRNVRKLVRNIRLGKATDVSANRSKRWKNMLRIALGQQKMMVRPVAGILHIFGFT